MTTTQTKTPVGRTLAQFTTNLDHAAGGATGFTEAVVSLAAVRAHKALIADRRKEVFAALCEHYERGNLVVNDELVLRKTKANPGRLVRSVTAAAVKKHDARLWAAARVPTPHVQVTVPVGESTMMAHRAAVAAGPLPPVPQMRTPLEQLAQWYRTLSNTRDVNAAERDAVARLRTVGEAVGWDGLPVEFTDGWKVSLSRMTYSDDKLREINPAVWDRLAVERVVGAGEGHVYLGKVTADGTVVDLDDGE